MKYLIISNNRAEPDLFIPINKIVAIENDKRLTYNIEIYSGSGSNKLTGSFEEIIRMVTGGGGIYREPNENPDYITSENHEPMFSRDDIPF